jgi:hypothetical protein
LLLQLGDRFLPVLNLSYFLAVAVKPARRGGGSGGSQLLRYTGEHLILHKREPVILVSAVRPQMRSESSIAHKYNSFIEDIAESCAYFPYAYLKPI